MNVANAHGIFSNVDIRTDISGYPFIQKNPLPNSLLNELTKRKISEVEGWIKYSYYWCSKEDVTFLPELT